VRAKFALLILILALLLGACGPKATVAPTAIPSETPTPAPTLTPTPSTPLAILVVPTDMDKATSDLYQKTVYDLAQASGFRFQVRNTLSAADVLDSTLKVVIVLPPDPGIAVLAAAAPQAQFMVVNVPGITAGGNVSVLANNADVLTSAFLAGYVAAMVTDDYRVGMIIPKDNPQALQAFQAFANGMAYSCGQCTVVNLYAYPWCVPLYPAPCFPRSVEIPSDAKADTYGAYADILMTQNNVETIYVYPDVATDALLTYLGTVGVASISNTMPAQRPASFIMAMQPDTIKAIQAAWPDLIAGKGGVSIQSPLGMTNIDPALLTEGKQRLADQVLLDLLAGRIKPLSQ
jgi:hypothetical protein